MSERFFNNIKLNLPENFGVTKNVFCYMDSCPLINNETNTSSTMECTIVYVKCIAANLHMERDALK